MKINALRTLPYPSIRYVVTTGKWPMYPSIKAATRSWKAKEPFHILASTNAVAIGEWLMYSSTKAVTNPLVKIYVLLY